MGGSTVRLQSAAFDCTYSALHILRSTNQQLFPIPFPLIRNEPVKKIVTDWSDIAIIIVLYKMKAVAHKHRDTIFSHNFTPHFPSHPNLLFKNHRLLLIVAQSYDRNDSNFEYKMKQNMFWNANHNRRSNYYMSLREFIRKFQSHWKNSKQILKDTQKINSKMDIVLSNQPRKTSLRSRPITQHCKQNSTKNYS